jgi:BioD-like phosphotransacetylase family protein
MSNNISTVRQHLLDTLADLRNRENPMEIERAKAVAQVAGVLIDSAKVEVEFIKATSADKSDFIQPEEVAETTPTELPSGITGITKHRLAG